MMRAASAQKPELASTARPRQHRDWSRWRAILRSTAHSFVAGESWRSWDRRPVSRNVHGRTSWQSEESPANIPGHFQRIRQGACSPARAPARPPQDATVRWGLVARSVVLLCSPSPCSIKHVEAPIRLALIRGYAVIISPGPSLLEGVRGLSSSPVGGGSSGPRTTLRVGRR